MTVPIPFFANPTGVGGSSGINTPTITAPPSTASQAAQMLAAMNALTGVLTDYNVGSQVRTISESVGAVGEQQGVWSTTLAFQTLVYSALSLFGITPIIGSFASGTVTFLTSLSSAAASATQNVPIPLGTIVQTPGGVQFQTTSGVVLISGTVSIDAPVSALLAGTAGNVAASAVTQIITGLNYPIICNNYSGMAGGGNPQSTNVALGQFATIVASIGLSSPVAIANACMGVSGSSSSEQVAYAAVYEPWIEAGSASGSGQAFYWVLIDNGSGTATAALQANVNAVLMGGTNSSGISNASGALGFHDAGVPFTVTGVQTMLTTVVVGVTGVANPGYTDSQLSGAIATAVNAYFTLPFGGTAYQGQIAAVIGDATLGQLSSLVVQLGISGGASSVVSAAPASVSGRIYLGALNLALS